MTGAMCEVIDAPSAPPPRWLRFGGCLQQAVVDVYHDWQEEPIVMWECGVLYAGFDYESWSRKTCASGERYVSVCQSRPHRWTIGLACVTENGRAA